MSHDPALDAHEQHEHAEHAEHDPFVARVAITVAMLAVLAAATGSLETIEDGRAITSESEAVLAQDRATDAWNEYQADSLKKHMYTLAADQGGSQADKYRTTAKQQADSQKDVHQRATGFEADRERLVHESQDHETRHHWLSGAATMLEIGIALSTVAIITRRRFLWFGALLLGAGGISLLALAYAT
jgi:hypothetical protein